MLLFVSREAKNTYDTESQYLNKVHYPREALVRAIRAMSPCTEEQREQFSPFFRRKQQMSHKSGAGGTWTDPLPPSFSSGQPQCPVRHDKKMHIHAVYLSEVRCLVCERTDLLCLV